MVNFETLNKEKTRGATGEHEMKGGCLWILWNGDPFIVTLFFLNPDRIKGGCERFAFSLYARIRDENDEYLAKIKASTEYELVLMYYLIN